MKAFVYLAALLSAAAVAALPTHAAEANFERTLTLNGRADLTISDGAGTIHVSAGPAGQIHVVGRVRSNWGGSDDRVRDIAAHPPIQQSGNIVRIGGHITNIHNITIDYEVQAPPDAFLNAATGSGNVAVDGVGANAKLESGSGTIHATGLRGGFQLSTGSGSIYAEQNGAGDVRAETGSGSIELRNLNGALRAETGSGSIKAGGKPAGPWKLETGSGSVDIWTGDASFELDAECGSGNIRSDRQLSAQTASNHHHLAGKVGSGGPMVRIETGSGGIAIH